MTTNFRSAFARANVSAENGDQARGAETDASVLVSFARAIGGAGDGADAHPIVARSNKPASRIGTLETTLERARRFHRHSPKARRNPADGGSQSGDDFRRRRTLCAAVSSPSAPNAEATMHAGRSAISS
jgi:hypothetical protein